MTRSRARSLLFRLIAVCTLLLLISSPAPAGQASLPGDIPEALKGLDVQDSYVPAGSFARAGVVHALQGTLVVVHRADQTAFAASQGDPIHENDELFTLAGSRCRIRLLTDDVVNIAPETRFSVERFMDRPEQGEKTSLFRMIKGKAMFYALRLFRYRETRFKVETPTAIVGVRGTQFGVHVFWLDGGQAQARGVRVADRGDQGLAAYLAQAGGGGRSGTVVACGDGQLDVTDPATGEQLARVNPNEVFTSFTGEKTFDPQNRTLNGIADDTQVEEEGGDQGTGTGDETGGTEGQDQDQGDETAGTGEDDTAGAPVDVTDLTTDVTTQQTGDETETQEGTHRDYPVNHFGYFNGILTASSGNGGYYWTKSLKDLDGTGTVDGHREGVDVGDMSYDGSGAPGIKQITALTHNGNTVDAGLPADVDYWLYGHDAYLIWGAWRQPVAMTDTGSGIEHYFDYRGYFFVGDDTTDAQMAALKGSLGTVTYSGDVFAKHGQQPAGTDMSGTFTAQVNFSSPAVTDFDMSASGGGHTASITDATGSFTGNTSQFVLNTSSGSWHVDGMSAMFKDGRGGLFGDQAQKMGVIWTMKEGPGSPNWAYGMCVGGR